MPLENFNINSGDDYADLIIQDLIDSKMGMDEPLFRYWTDDIRKMCVRSYDKYIKGSTDSFMLSEEEIMNSYKEASLKYTGELLESLVEKGVVSLGINTDGEIVYLTKNKSNESI